MSNRLNLLVASALALAVSPAAFAEKLEITGELMTSTCSVDATGGTVTVPMGKVDVASVNGSTGNLALDATSVATNVGVALYDASGNQQKLGEDPLQWVDIPAAGTGQLDYSAWYSSPGRNATAGSANATGDFVVLYD